MTKIIRKLTVIAIVALMAIVFKPTASAMDFQVRPNLPDNQRQNDSTFFDLLVSPGQEQDLVIEITNRSENDIVVLVETITASTSRSGQINYTSRGELDETLKFSFEDLVSLPQSHFEIPALSNIEVAINLKVPDEVFDGAILGSIRVLREATQEERDASGVLYNQFASVTAVRLVHRENAEDIPVDFVLGDITAELVNYRASIIVPIRNTQPRIIKDATATARIYYRDSNMFIFEYHLDRLEFAPNSVFPFSFVDEEGYGIDAGNYTAEIDVEYAGEIWSFVQDFQITEEEAAIVNEGALNQHGQVRPGTGVPLWAIVAIATGAAVFIAIILLIVVISRKSKRARFPGRYAGKR